VWIFSILVPLWFVVIYLRGWAPLTTLIVGQNKYPLAFHFHYFYISELANFDIYTIIHTWLRGLRDKTNNRVHPPTWMWFLLGYFPKPRTHIRTLTYWNWPIECGAVWWLDLFKNRGIGNTSFWMRCSTRSLLCEYCLYLIRFGIHQLVSWSILFSFSVCR